MTTAETSAARDALVERLFDGVLGMTDVYTVYMGDRLGIYEALADGKSSEAEIAFAILPIENDFWRGAAARAWSRRGCRSAVRCSGVDP